MTVKEFQALLQKNLDELIWRDKGWGPIPIHGKGEKGFSKQGRLEYNASMIASMEIDDDKLDKANQLLVARTDKLNDMFSQGKITREKKDKIIDGLSKTFEKNVEKRKQLHAQIAQKQKVIDKLKTSISGGRAFATKKAAHEFGMKYHEIIASKLTDSEVMALKGYKGTSYSDINNRLRGSDINGLTDEKIKQIDLAMDKAKLTRSVTVHRGIKVYEPLESAGMQEKAQYNRLRSIIDNPTNAKGIIISDNAFVSTSLHKPLAASWGNQILLNIKVPKQTKVLYLDAIYDRKEYEMLLPRGSKFQIRSTAKVGSKLEIDVDLIK